MRTFASIAFAVSLTIPGMASATPLENLGLMMVIKSLCHLDTPSGVYEREIKRHVEATGDTLTTVAMRLAVEAVDIRGKIGDGQEENFCSDVAKTYGPKFFGE